MIVGAVVIIVAIDASATIGVYTYAIAITTSMIT